MLTINVLFILRKVLISFLIENSAVENRNRFYFKDGLIIMVSSCPELACFRDIPAAYKYSRHTGYRTSALHRNSAREGKN